MRGQPGRTGLKSPRFHSFEVLDSTKRKERRRVATSELQVSSPAPRIKRSSNDEEDGDESL